MHSTRRCSRPPTLIGRVHAPLACVAPMPIMHGPRRREGRASRRRFLRGRHGGPDQSAAAHRSGLRALGAALPDPIGPASVLPPSKTRGVGRRPPASQCRGDLSRKCSCGHHVRHMLHAASDGRSLCRSRCYRRIHGEAEMAQAQYYVEINNDYLKKHRRVTRLLSNWCARSVFRASASAQVGGSGSSAVRTCWPARIWTVR